MRFSHILRCRIHVGICVDITPYECTLGEGFNIRSLAKQKHLESLHLEDGHRKYRNHRYDTKQCLLNPRPTCDIYVHHTIRAVWSGLRNWVCFINSGCWLFVTAGTHRQWLGSETTQNPPTENYLDAVVSVIAVSKLFTGEGHPSSITRKWGVIEGR